jgi:hypothetical protein
MTRDEGLYYSPIAQGEDMTLIIAVCTTEGNLIVGDTKASVGQQWSTPGEHKVLRTEGGVVVGFTDGGSFGKQIINDLRAKQGAESSAMIWAKAVQEELGKHPNLPSIGLTFVDTICKKPIRVGPGQVSPTGQVVWWADPHEANAEVDANGVPMLVGVLYHYMRPKKFTLLTGAAFAVLSIEMTSEFSRNVGREYEIEFADISTPRPSISAIMGEVNRIKNVLREHIWP